MQVGSPLSTCIYIIFSFSKKIYHNALSQNKSYPILELFITTGNYQHSEIINKQYLYQKKYL